MPLLLLVFELVGWCGVRLKFPCEDHSFFCVGNVLLLELTVLPWPTTVLPCVECTVLPAQRSTTAWGSDTTALVRSFRPSGTTAMIRDTTTLSEARGDKDGNGGF